MARRIGIMCIIAGWVLLLLGYGSAGWPAAVFVIGLALLALGGIL